MASVTYTDVEKLQQTLSEILMDEWESQGHSMTGKVVKEIEYQIKQDATSLTLLGLAPFYGNIIAAGVKPARIPYSGRSGRGGVSKYIQGLQNYVKARMNISDDRKSLGIAFAIANTHKKEGMPTNRSYSFSTTGKRKDWIEEAFRKNEDRITEAVREWATELISVHLDATLAKWQIELNK